MARSSDPKKAALWQRRFRRFLGSGLPVARFCAAEDVSEASFYYWQKKLGRLERGRAVGAEDDAAGRGRRRAVKEDRRVFRPVTVVAGDRLATGGIVIQMSGGTRIEVDANHLDAIRAIVAEMLRVDHDQTARPHTSADNRIIRQRNGRASC